MLSVWTSLADLLLVVLLTCTEHLCNNFNVDREFTSYASTLLGLDKKMQLLQLNATLPSVRPGRRQTIGWRSIQTCKGVGQGA